MSLIHRVWNDETGAVVSAEAVMVGSIVVVGATVGLKTASNAVNDELTEVAHAIRSLDQSYHYEGFKTDRAFTASSTYTQRPVEESLRELCGDEDAAAESEEAAATPRILEPTPPEDPVEADAVEAETPSA
ncbi:MAG: hypothetical protein WEB58_03655 [Planctomycetaceae bacterium]